MSWRLSFVLLPAQHGLTDPTAFDALNVMDDHRLLVP
jgi:hypothetical protein